MKPNLAYRGVSKVAASAARDTAVGSRLTIKSAQPCSDRFALEERRAV